MSKESTIRAGRRFHEALMVSTCKITRVVGREAVANSLKMEPQVETIYEGKCRLRISAASAGISERDILAQTIAVGELELSLPIVVAEPDQGSTADVRKNDNVFIKTNPEDPALVERNFRVLRSVHQSTATQRRLTVEEVE